MKPFFTSRMVRLLDRQFLMCMYTSYLGDLQILMETMTRYHWISYLLNNQRLISVLHPQVYPALDKSEDAMNEGLSTAARKRQPLPMIDARAGTPPRTAEEMEKEATWLRSFFEQ